MTDKPKARRGRPPKSEVESYKKGAIGKGKVGRPSGMAARIEEFKARLLSTNGERVIDKIIHTALEDGHPAQSACMKMCFDRLIPISSMEPKGAGPSQPIVQINISPAMGGHKEIEVENPDIITDVGYDESE